MLLYTAVVSQGEAKLVEIETVFLSGIPQITITGMAGQTIKEAKDRWVAAINACGEKLPNKKIIVNLKPSEIRKEGTQVDAAIALGLLLGSSSGVLKAIKIGVLGELSLSGEMQSTVRQYGLAQFLLEQDLDYCVIPLALSRHMPLAHSSKVIAVSHFSTLIQGLKKGVFDQDTLPREALMEMEVESVHDEVKGDFEQVWDYSEVQCQELAKLALVYAVAGKHHLLMSGPPGSGKSMLAKRIPSIQQRLSAKEIEAMRRSRALLDYPDALLSWQADEPFRMPHMSASVASIMGGAKGYMIGEAVLANGGVLFLDELPEFKRDVLESLRGPLEDRYVSVSKVGYKARLDSDFTLIATANPCRCGYHGHSPSCNCNDADVKKYRSRLSGPLLDRFSIHIPIVYHEPEAPLAAGLDSRTMRAMVSQIRSVQLQRYGVAGLTNGNVSEVQFFRSFQPEAKALLYIEEKSVELNLSQRRVMQIKRLARTIADSKEEAAVSLATMTEATYFNLAMRW